MNKYTIALLVLLASVCSLGAQEPTKSYSVTTDFTYATKYVFRGTQLAKDSLQGTVKVDIKDFYVSVWATQPTVRNSNNEFDYTVGFNHKLNDYIGFDIGAVAYTYPTTHSHTTEGFAGLNLTLGSLSLGAYSYRDINLNTTTYQGNAAYEFSLGEKVSLVFSGNYGRVYHDYDYWQYGVALPIKVTNAFTVTIGVNRAADYADKTNWGTASFTYVF